MGAVDHLLELGVGELDYQAAVDRLEDRSVEQGLLVQAVSQEAQPAEDSLRVQRIDCKGHAFVVK